MTIETAYRFTKHMSLEESEMPRKARSRFEPKPIAGLVLTPRDSTLLSDLYLHGVMSRGQIQALHFGSVPRCNQRLRQLYDFGFLERHSLPEIPCVAPFGVQFIYSIGKAAIPIVASHLGLDVAEVTQGYRRSLTPSYLTHTLEIVNVHLAFRQAIANQSRLRIERWLPEGPCRHEYKIKHRDGTHWIKEVFKPDAFVRLALPTGELYSYFIEVDLGHTSARQFLGKLHTHQRYLESGLFRETFGSASFKTLVITNSIGRQKNLLRLLEEQQSQLFWFSTFDAIKQQSVLEAIWHVPLQRSLMTLTPTT